MVSRARTVSRSSRTAQPAYGAAGLRPARPGLRARPYAPPAKSPTLSILSLVGGIIGVVLGWVYGIGFPFGVAAVILGFIGKTQGAGARGFWLTGIITGFVSIAFSLIIWAVIIIAIIALRRTATARTDRAYRVTEGRPRGARRPSVAGQSRAARRAVRCAVRRPA